ncbi:c-type cytochrome [soil metagenome]
MTRSVTKKLLITRSVIEKVHIAHRAMAKTGCYNYFVFPNTRTLKDSKTLALLRLCRNLTRLFMHSRFMPSATFGLLLLALSASPSWAQHGQPTQYQPNVKPASAEPLEAMSRIKLPKGFQVELFAAEPMLANPFSFCLDNRNRIYVIETFRLNAGVEDDRGHMSWLDDDLANRTVADRVAMYKKHLGKKVSAYEKEHDRIRLIEDTRGTGKADKATVFADGFHHMDEGIGAGVLARDGRLWFACIPNLWQLRDTKGTGVADERKILQTGYGVHVSFIGHDLHGLIMGPDGKLYFSVGDRGARIEAGGKIHDVADTGAIFRCFPDGSEFEVFATGLRNPQELAFDDYGNLFTGDNNSDSGDKARWVYVVEGGDSGWRMGYQYIETPNSRGPFNAEKLWHPHFPEQAAYIVPPIANVADGPSGLVHYPGTGLSDRYKGHFFLCDFRGAANISGIRAFANKPKGAGFELIDQHQFIWNTLATDVDFSTDGAMYILDWVEGWSMPGKGRIYKVTDPEHAKDASVLSTKKLLAEGFAKRSTEELLKLLEHPDQRVRQEAQFALAEKKELQPLLETLKTNKNRLARIHCVWTIAQIGRNEPHAWPGLVPYARDSDSEIRAQVAKVLGNSKFTGSFEAPDFRVGMVLKQLLRDPEPRVRYFAALGFNKISEFGVFEAIEDFLRINDDKDPFLRHAGIMALTNFPPYVLEDVASDRSPAVRKAVAVAMRRLQMPAIARFLQDKDSLIVLAAARAINDVPIAQAMPDLAALIKNPIDSLPLGYRVLNANFREGKLENARAVAEFGARTTAPLALRLEAVRELTDLDHPSGRDRVMGLWRPIATRTPVAAASLTGNVKALFDGPSELLQDAALCVAKLKLKEAGPLLFQLLSDKQKPLVARIDALKALASLADPQLEQAMRLAIGDSQPKLRAEGRRVLAKLSPTEALAQIEKVLENGKTAEQQGALILLGEWTTKDADSLLGKWLDRLATKKASPEIQLELIEAASKRSAPALKTKLEAFEQARTKAPLLERFRESLQGGDGEEGKKLFLSKAEASCLRCHKAKGEGGEVGPDLSKIGSDKTREYILESILDPNKDLAQGFETAVFVLSNGKLLVGVVKSENANELKLQADDGALVTIKKADIEERLRGKSAMPEDVAKSLSKGELRDLVEFLSQLK